MLALMGAGVASVLAAASGAPGAQPGSAPKAAASATQPGGASKTAAGAAQPGGASKAAASATADAGAPRAAASAATDAGDELPLDAAPFPPEPSKQPTAAEWKAAPRVRLSRAGPAAAGCRAYRAREWLRIRCPELTVSAISLLGGKTEGVAFWIDPPRGGSELPRGGEVMFPIRRGDRRVIQILTFGPGYDGPFTLLPAIVIQEQWLEDEPAPTVTAS
ncbi:putative secreted protein [Sorangium cellulosum So ce56]|uniref:Secreted protein n=2 Tax=Sorangium cellulosum TaxID=56 RepID=A9EQZ3_SORC5|nr:putative secreted protein [Sorangium cellulosum So ce56]